MTEARFNTGTSFQAFVDSAIKLKELWDNAVKRAEVPQNFVDELRAIPGTWKMIALTEDWCIDAVSTLTPISKLIDLVPNAELRVFSRDANLDIMDAHLTHGGRSIPVIIVYDDQWNERGWWGPRPAEIQAWAITTGKIVTTEEKVRHVRTWYAHDKGQTALREFVDLISLITDGPGTKTDTIHVGAAQSA